MSNIIVNQGCYQLCLLFLIFGNQETGAKVKVYGIKADTGQKVMHLRLIWLTLLRVSSDFHIYHSCKISHFNLLHLEYFPLHIIPEFRHSKHGMIKYI